MERFIKVWIWVVICILLVAKKREVFVISLLEVFILQSFGFVQRVDSSMAFSFDTPPHYTYIIKKQNGYESHYFKSLFKSNLYVKANKLK